MSDPQIVKTLPCLMVVLDIGAGLIYLWVGDIRRAIYWLAAAVLTGAVTY